jgi:hypothetical protein
VKPDNYLTDEIAGSAVLMPNESLDTILNQLIPVYILSLPVIQVATFLDVSLPKFCYHFPVEPHIQPVVTSLI